MEMFVSSYCERAGLAGLDAEPLNAATNLAFLAAAVLAWRQLPAGRSLGASWDIAVLAALVFVIGLGSAAWHIWPVRATLLADVVPISLFIHAYLLAFVIRVLGLSWRWALAILGAYVVVGTGVPALLAPGAMSGTAAYLPACAMLALMCALLFAKRDERRWLLVLALALWTPSLALRSLDGEVCAWLPAGTHFLWHLLNAAVLYTLLRVLIVSAKDGKGWLPGPDSNQRPSG